jgi:hypothetical protein
LSSPGGGGGSGVAYVYGLPRSHTCFHQLVVPRFPSFEALAAAFDTALDHGNGGFYLS